ncbi:MAG: SLOG family protein [Candidatus Limivicinus sp.]|jgi:uncharacterized phage-like protein YoqJ
MEMRETSCCFSGHRPTKLPWRLNENDPRCIELKREIALRLENIYGRGYRHFYCGMAIGCDMYFADAVLAMKEIHPDISLEAVIPCASQPDRWAKPLRLRYNELLNRSSKVTLMQVNYSPDCMQKRNMFMVDNSSLVLACFNGSPGGTMKTLVYAMRQGIETEIIDI